MPDNDDHVAQLEHDYIVLHDQWRRDVHQFERIQPIYKATMALMKAARIRLFQYGDPSRLLIEVNREDFYQLVRACQRVRGRLEDVAQIGQEAC